MTRFWRSAMCVVLSVTLFLLSGCGQAHPDGTEDAASTLTTTPSGPASIEEISFRANGPIRLETGSAGLVYPVSFGGRILRSKAEYDAAPWDEMDYYGIPDSSVYQELDLSPYTADYFVDKALVIVFLTNGYGDIEVRADSLTVSDGSLLTVAYTVQYPSVVTCDGSDWCLLLEVDAATVQGVTEIVGEESEVYLSDAE